MGARCTNNSKATTAVTIGIAGGFAVLIGLLVIFDDGKGSGEALPFLVIMMGSAVAIGASSGRGGCCCFRKLFGRPKAAEATADAGSEPNPYAPDRGS